MEKVILETDHWGISWYKDASGEMGLDGTISFPSFTAVGTIKLFRGGGQFYIKAKLETIGTKSICTFQLRQRNI